MARKGRACVLTLRPVAMVGNGLALWHLHLGAANLLLILQVC